MRKAYLKVRKMKESKTSYELINCINPSEEIIIIEIYDTTNTGNNKARATNIRHINTKRNYRKIFRNLVADKRYIALDQMQIRMGEWKYLTDELYESYEKENFIDDLAYELWQKYFAIPINAK